MTLSPSPNLSNRGIFIFSIASDPALAHRLVATADQHHLPLHVHEHRPWTGYVDKIGCMIGLLSSDEIAPDDCVDAYDVLCYADKAEILRKFEVLDCALVLGAELTCYPEENQLVYDYVRQEQKHDQNKRRGLRGLAQSANCPLRGRSVGSPYYVNSGGYMGTKAALLAMLTWKPLDQIKDICILGGDQNYVTQYYLEHALTTDNRIKLDTEQVLFQNLHKVDLAECSFRGGRFHNDVLDTWPCFVHFNGYNYYDFMLVHQETGVSENILDACMLLSEESAIKVGDIRPIPYNVPYYIVYQGVEQRHLPQVRGTRG
jgi:hypothetical protein